MIAALWTGGMVILAVRVRSWAPYVLAGGLPLAWVGVWASGSRTAFVAAAVVALFTLAACVRLMSTRRVHAGRRLRAAAAAGVIAGAIVIALAVNTNSEAEGPVRRLWNTLPSPSVESLRNFAAELWNRNRYGTVSTGMIREFPLVGVGVGSFHYVMSNYTQRFSPGDPLVADNAQNWYRHQLAELGILGSLGWLAWLGVFGWFVLKRQRGAAVDVWAARGVLVGFALVSLVGMPAQDMIVNFTFWTMAFWYVSIVGAPPDRPLVGRRAWPVILAVLVAFGIGTAIHAVGSLRVPHRAQRNGWSYAYGLFPPEPDGWHRWTARKAVAVIEAPSDWIELSVSVDHLRLTQAVDAPPSAPTRPVTARVWCNGELVVDETLTTTAPIVRRVQLPDGASHVMLESRVDRVLRPRDFGLADDRELGMLIGWRFVDGSP
jgi:hypothetical protein